jgi:hypothetical protein
MIEIAAQIKDDYSLHPFSQEDLDELREYKPNQVVKVKITGCKKQRSYLQLKLFWGCCKTVASNTNDENWNSKDKVAEQVKIKCRYIKSYIVVDGNVHIVTGSISYKEMGHMQACNFIDNAIEEMANFLGVPRNELAREAEKES